MLYIPLGPIKSHGKSAFPRTPFLWPRPKWRSRRPIGRSRNAKPRRWVNLCWLLKPCWIGVWWDFSASYNHIYIYIIYMHIYMRVLTIKTWACSWYMMVCCWLVDGWLMISSGGILSTILGTITDYRPVWEILFLGTSIPWNDKGFWHCWIGDLYTQHKKSSINYTSQPEFKQPTWVSFGPRPGSYSSGAGEDEDIGGPMSSRWMVGENEFLQLWH
jgi:hypothetical protein